MDILRLFQNTDREIVDAITALHKRNQSGYEESEEIKNAINKLSSGSLDVVQILEIGIQLQNSIYHPSNIFYIRHTEERGIYRVFLTYPRKVLKAGQKITISFYKVKFETLKEILKVLKLDFTRISYEIIVRRSNIINVDEREEKVIIERKVHDSILDKHTIKQHEPLFGGRKFLKKIVLQGIHMDIRLPKKAKAYGFTPKRMINGQPIINPMEILYFKKSHGKVFLQLEPDEKTESSRSFTWNSKLTLIELLNHLGGGTDILVQTNRNYVVSEYALMSSPLLKNNIVKLRINRFKDEWIDLPVSDARKKLFEIFLLSANYDVIENKVFKACRFDKDKTENILKAKRDGEIEIHITPYNSVIAINENWSFLGEIENIEKIYYIQI